MTYPSCAGLPVEHELVERRSCMDGTADVVKFNDDCLAIRSDLNLLAVYGAYNTPPLNPGLYVNALLTTSLLALLSLKKTLLSTFAVAVENVPIVNCEPLSIDIGPDCIESVTHKFPDIMVSFN
jgi:hypothetical protein